MPAFMKKKETTATVLETPSAKPDVEENNAATTSDAKPSSSQGKTNIAGNETKASRRPKMDKETSGTLEATGVISLDESLNPFSVSIKSNTPGRPFSVKGGRVYFWDSNKEAACISVEIKQEHNVTNEDGITILLYHPEGCRLNANTMLALCINGAESMTVQVKDGQNTFRYMDSKVPNPNDAALAIVNDAMMGGNADQTIVFAPIVPLKDTYVVMCLSMPGCYRSTTSLDEITGWHGLSDTIGCALLSRDEVEKHFDAFLTDGLPSHLKELIIKKRSIMLEALWENEFSLPVEIPEVKDMNDSADIETLEITACQKALASVIVNFILLLLGIIGIKGSVSKNIKTKFALNLERHLAATEINGLILQVRAIKEAGGIFSRCRAFFAFLGAIHKVGCFSILERALFQSVSLWTAIKFSVVAIGQMLLWASSDGTLLVAELVTCEPSIEDIVRNSVQACKVC